MEEVSWLEGCNTTPNLLGNIESMRTNRFQRALLLIALCLATTVASGQFIVGHRGASRDAPENTLASFRLAWQRGADGIEGDYYLTSDGRVVCIHDADTQRVAGKKLVVAESTFAELRQLDVGVWKGAKWRGEKIPTLEEVLSTVPAGKKIFIELKVGPEIVEPVATILAASHLKPAQIVIISFLADTLAACERRLPYLRTHWLTGYRKGADGKWEPTARQIDATLDRIHADGLGSMAVPEYVNASFVEQLRHDGLREFHVWTVDDPVVARLYQRLGAWGITTNRPGWLHHQLWPTE